MSTINTMDDLFQILRDSPEWREELREIAGATELADLPEKFAEFAKETRARMDASDARFDDFVNKIFTDFVEETRARMDASDARFDDFVNKIFTDFVEETWARMDASDAKMDASDARFTEFAEETWARMDASDAKMDASDARFTEFAEETWARMDASDAKMDASDARFTEFAEETRAHNAATDATIKVMKDDIGELKGSNAMNAAIRRPDLIVFALSEDMRYQKTLAASDLMDMIRARPGIVPQDAKMSFLEADLAIHAKDSSGEDHYIAAEVSYTVGSRDVDRAIRNADFLRMLTDKQSHAMVVGNDINGTAEMIVEREGVAWYQLRRRYTRPR